MSGFYNQRKRPYRGGYRGRGGPPRGGYQGVENTPPPLMDTRAIELSPNVIPVGVATADARGPGTSVEFWVARLTRDRSKVALQANKVVRNTNFFWPARKLPQLKVFLPFFYHM